jgi:nitrile hydratase
MSYYERWFTVLVNRLLRSNLITQTELESGKPDPSRPNPEPPPPPAPQAAQGAAGGAAQPSPAASAGQARQNVQVAARFKLGQRVRGRNIHPEGHTRMPRYTRGRIGTIVRGNGVFGLQDTDANGQSLGRKPQHVWTVKFAARELWGGQASPRDCVHVELWEDYLERA